MNSLKNSKSTVFGILLLVIALSMENSMLKTLLLLAVVMVLLTRLSYMFYEACRNLQKVKSK